MACLGVGINLLHLQRVVGVQCHKWLSAWVEQTHRLWLLATVYHNAAIGCGAAHA
jgi:hypothetical protein